MIEIWFIFCVIGAMLWFIFDGKIENLGQALFWSALVCFFSFETHFAINLADKNSPTFIESKDGRPIVAFLRPVEKPIQTNGEVIIKGDRIKYNGVYYIKDAFQND